MRITSVATTDQAPKTTLAEQLKRLRQSKGHPTARGFAKTLGISENRYSRYERGEAVPKLDLVWAICAELGITPNELYGWDAPSDDARPQPHRHPGSAKPTAGRSSASATPGMADETSQFTHQPQQSQPANSAIAAATWRMAAVLAKAHGPTGESKLLAIRATAELYSKLKTDPFQTIATCLQSLDLDTGLENGASDLEARLASEVETFLATLGADRDLPDPPPAI